MKTINGESGFKSDVTKCKLCGVKPGRFGLKPSYARSSLCANLSPCEIWILDVVFCVIYRSINSCRACCGYHFINEKIGVAPLYLGQVTKVVLLIFFWSCIGLLHAVSKYIESKQLNYPFNLDVNTALSYTLSSASWAIATLLVYWAINRFVDENNKRRHIYIFLLGLIIWVPIHKYLDHFTWQIIVWQPPENLLRVVTDPNAFYVFFDVLLYNLIYGVCAFYVYYRKYQENQLRLVNLEKARAKEIAERAEFQMQALQYQLSPHFLFNVLNSISSLARNDRAKDIVSVVTELGDLLRYVIGSSDARLIPLADEILFSKGYIKLQEIRFSQKYHFTFNIDIKSENVKCIPFCLQTLIENIYTHNDGSSEKIFSEIHVKDNEGLILISVVNRPSNEKNKSNLGVGLRNLQKRLILTYGEKAVIDIGRIQGGFRTMISFPGYYE